MDLIIASNNAAKVREMKELVRELPLRVLSLKDAGIFVEVEETGETFEANAKIKALEIWKLASAMGCRSGVTGDGADGTAGAKGCIVMANDSGLCVDAMDGAPGVYSARYAGEGATDEQRNQKLLHALQDTAEDKRSARFVCAICLVLPPKSEGNNPQIELFSGLCEGVIAFAPTGTNGFGYDPLLYLPEYRKSMAELSPEEKNKVSHRGKAVRAALRYLSEELNEPG